MARCDHPILVCAIYTGETLVVQSIEEMCQMADMQGRAFALRLCKR